MIELEAIRKRARQDLVVATDTGLEDVHLWEHSLRVTEAAQQIARLPEVASGPVDNVVITVAGLYHDAGWVTQVTDGDTTREAIRCKPTSPLQRELGATMMEQCLAGMLPGKTLAAASACIRAIGDRDVDILEAQLIAEADNLDAFGALSLWRLARKHVIEGRGLEAAFETWETQERYGYWTARINDSFRFHAVKRIAHQRLKTFARMIGELRSEYHGEDLLAVLAATSASA